ncbi:hypothetical protein EV193_10372 [Herbihabitans rhizosphaerae]|uniref:Uncharacterized protein n=1 Tax=Herbihabitans rhizosphaerae TaxID=1872711 RepID=A0A4Q7KUT0_9PSEU|nr:hypothetical protein [Herbihabitans rhizosphaerae]RZS40759.1 hypothetical protein EV193_10372 [Herbihabitans rhizosphaerae]
MGWLFGQVWLWCLIAFVLGILIGWLIWGRRKASASDERAASAERSTVDRERAAGRDRDRDTDRAKGVGTGAAVGAAAGGAAGGAAGLIGRDKDGKRDKESALDSDAAASDAGVKADKGALDDESGAERTQAMRPVGRGDARDSALSTVDNDERTTALRPDDSEPKTGPIPVIGQHAKEGESSKAGADAGAKDDTDSSTAKSAVAGAAGGAAAGGITAALTGKEGKDKDGKSTDAKADKASTASAVSTPASNAASSSTSGKLDSPSTSDERTTALRPAAGSAAGSGGAASGTESGGAKAWDFGDKGTDDKVTGPPTGAHALKDDAPAGAHAKESDSGSSAATAAGVGGAAGLAGGAVAGGAKGSAGTKESAGIGAAQGKQPYGPGSAEPLADGAAPSKEYTVKGNADSMMFHTTDSPYYGRTKAEVWFKTAADAEKAGFTAWNRKGGNGSTAAASSTSSASESGSGSTGGSGATTAAAGAAGVAGGAAVAGGVKDSTSSSGSGTTAVKQPYGPGSAEPLADGAAPSKEYTVKGNADSMMFHTTDSPYYGRTKAEVWFKTAADAEKAGFTAWTRKGANGSTAEAAKPSYEPGAYANSAKPLKDGSAPTGEFAVKGNEDSMLFHTTDSPYYTRTVAEVWFKTADDAEKAGFTAWNKRRTTAPAAKPAVKAGPYPGSAMPTADGSAPSEDYVVKGNDDSKLFHTKESPFYNVTTAEVWFKSASEAEKAGFRAWKSVR